MPKTGGGRKLQAATPGNPSFPDAGPSVEVHLLGFNGNIYGKELKIYFIEKIRDEIKFDSVDKLKEQIQKDESDAKSIFHLV